MKKETIFKIVKISSVVLSVFNLLLFFAMRCCWSGISKTLGYENGYSKFILDLPIYVCVLFLIVAGVNTVLFFLKKKEKSLWGIVMLSLDIVLLIVIIVIIALGAKDYMRFIWVELFKSLGIVAALLAVLFLIFIYPKTKLKDNKIFKLVTLTCLLLTTIGYLVNFNINSITYKPVVYVVEDTYQIVFSSNVKSVGWVEINGKEYHELASGSKKSSSKVHKIVVPQEDLNNAKSYSIHTQKIVYRGPFGGIWGKEISENYNFRPVNTSDGIEYFALADVHMALEYSVMTASYTNMEFLVFAGDVISMMDTFADANFTNKVAHEITKGEIPVVYARGNHEVKGKMAEQFHKFVGAKGENFYYSFKLDNIYGWVLDIGEDHDDDYWEYYNTANYDQYRQDQIDFLEKEIESKEYEKYDYRLVVCHIPIVFVNSRKNHEYCKAEFTRLLNQLDVDMALSGHQHDLFVFEPGLVAPNEKLKYHGDYGSKTYKGYLTDFNFPNLLISKRGFTQTDDSDLTKVKSQIGLKINVNFTNQTQICTYLTSYGDNVLISNPFADKFYGDKIEISLITKEFKEEKEPIF